MATLLENLKFSLIETRQRYTILKDKGIDSMRTVYPAIPYNLELYNQLLDTLPQEIARLEQRIQKIEAL
ncbi:hypothetical protein [Neobacillus terrae]|uniref:hypothetical protein n=1 Tax=Neobacillus terrae TaxID=3034837 RepID=UPI00140A34A3|nr:hypothetical protein [Neobacillus terrae]NHM30768.1 hypothetical protein [Neobacillus terrae]